jgi:hypothetical protein
MRNLFYIFITLFLFLNLRVIYSSDWAPIGAKWYYTSARDGKCVLMESIKDTILLGQNCKKLEIKYCESGELIGHQYIYSINDTVLLYDDSTFVLLYDFSVNPGDTITVFDDYFYPDNSFLFLNLSPPYKVNKFIYRVIDTSSIFVSSVRLKSQQIDDMEESSEWTFKSMHPQNVKKIGNLNYFFGRISFLTPEDPNAILRCYEDFEISYKNQNWTNSCDYENYSRITNHSDSSEQFKVLTNPFNDEIVLDCLPETHYKLYDIAGNLLNEGIGNRITTDNLPKGIYLLNLRQGTYSRSFKLTKHLP